MAKGKAIGVSILILFVTWITGLFNTFSTFIIQWFTFFMVLTSLAELLFDVDLKLVYIILMILFLIAFLYSRGGKGD